MSKDHVLKKQFQERDVQRLRNLVQGKFGEKTRSSVGFSKAEEFHDEGDIWESDGRTWTIKNGIKQNITKLDKAKKAHVMPLLCPCCNKIMKNRHDKSFYNVHQKCFNCVIDFEHDLKKQGKWEQYQIDIKNGEIDKQIEEFKIITTTIARGISVGDELEYADEVTLGRSIVNRIPFEASLKI